MSPFAIQLINGFLVSDLEEEDLNNFQKLQELGTIEQVDQLWKLRSLYRVGTLYLGKDGRGFVEAETKEQKDLLIEPDNLAEAGVGDSVIAKRIIARRGRASGKIILVLSQANPLSIVYTYRDVQGRFEIRNIKNFSSYTCCNGRHGFKDI